MDFAVHDVTVYMCSITEVENLTLFLGKGERERERQEIWSGREKEAWGENSRLAPKSYKTTVSGCVCWMWGYVMLKDLYVY